MNERNQQMVDASCGGMFLHKTPEEAWELFEHLSENGQQHATSAHTDISRQLGNRGVCEIAHREDLTNKVDLLSKKVDQLLSFNKMPMNSNVHDVCYTCASPTHSSYECPYASHHSEFSQEQINAAQGFPSHNNPYSNTYNPGWRNHPNFSWRQQGGDGQQGQRPNQGGQSGMVFPPGFQTQRYIPCPPQASSSNSGFEDKVLLALKSLESKTQILDSHTQSIAKLETQIGQY